MLIAPGRDIRVAVACTLLVLAVAVLDLLSPLGVAAAALYSIVIAASLLIDDPRLTKAITVLSLVLILLGGLASPDSNVPSWMVVFNRTIFMIMAMITAMLVSYRQRDARQIRDQQLQLEIINQELEQLAQSDGLTGVANRRAFDEQLDRECARANRSSQLLSLLMIDVDHFKLYNDTAGHPAGDDALKDVAGVISRASRRPIDFAARYGGEEFAVILPATDAAGACERAEEIRRAVHDLFIHHPGLPGAMLTVSIGTATLAAPVLPAALVQHADTALYRAKSSGRDNVVCEDRSPRRTVTA